MIYPSIDKLLNQVGSKYLLVNIVPKRAKEMDETSFYQMKENVRLCLLRLILFTRKNIHTFFMDRGW